ncbi:hypothetical protein [uncultured Chloroflexus sp.]|uniref:hypothetical protein n=1 Tax=uncultured Chloroflexus sp. TaxID=214040 RepID=UPI002615E901|nr:hypothetical protein [uncultured Chloroflexus sp.]
MYKRLFVLFILLWVSACASPTALPLPTDVVATAALGQQQLIAFLYRDEQGVRLVNGLSVSTARPIPLDPPDQQVWIGEVALPANLALTEAGDVQYGMVIAQGDWQPTGQYGPGGLWPHALASPRLQPFTPETVALADLLSDTRYEGQVVRLRAALIVSTGTSLLVEAIGPGGVPAADARQVKLWHGDRDQALIERLQVSGAVRFGYVEVVGRWRQGRVEPLLIILP